MAEENYTKLLLELNIKTDNLTRKDIRTWRNAHQLAITVDNPYRAPLYDVYSDALIDLHLSGAIEQRTGVTLRKSFKIVDKRKVENEKLKELFETEWFNDFCTLVLDSRFWGHSLIQFNSITNNNNKMEYSSIELVPRKHVIPEYGVIVRDVGDEWKKGRSYLDSKLSKWVIPVGKPKDLGLLLKCCPQTISKKNMLAYWDAFGEIFGMPVRIGRSNTRNDIDLKVMESNLEKLGAAGWAMLPEGSSIEFIETNRGDAFEVYDKRVDRCNSEISKGILTQTMTMDDGSSRSQSETHLDVFKNVVDKDAEFLKNVVNWKLIPLMISHGFPLQGYRFEYDESIDWTPEQQIRIEELLLGYYEIEHSYFAEKYNINIIGPKKNPETEEQLAAPFFQNRVVANPPDLKLFHTAMNQLYELSTIEYDGNGKSIFDSETIDNLAKWLHEIKEVKPDIMTDPNAANIVNTTADRLIKPLQDLNISQEIHPELTIGLLNNTFHFSGFKGYNLLKAASLLLIDKNGGFKPFEQFKQEILKIDSTYNINYLNAEYNMAIAAVQMANKWKEFQADGDRYNLQYRTAFDEKVRETHRPLHHITLPINDPFWQYYFPPNGWGCRCNVVQVRKKKYPVSDPQLAMALGDEATNTPKLKLFRFNPGINEKIFPDNHPYFQADKELAPIVEQLAEKWSYNKVIDHYTNMGDQSWDFDRTLKNVKVALDTIKEILKGTHSNPTVRNLITWNLKAILKNAQLVKTIKVKNDNFEKLLIYQTTVMDNKHYIAIGVKKDGTKTPQGIYDEEGFKNLQ